MGGKGNGEACALCFLASSQMTLQVTWPHVEMNGLYAWFNTPQD
jgi:hypothetical protein